MPHLPTVTPTGPLNRLAYAVARHRYGAVPEPLTLWAHSRRILLGVARFEQSVGAWSELDRTCKALAVLRAAQVVGCSWCIDFGSYISADDVTQENLAQLSTWRDSEVFTERQRLCLDYAEAASRTPVQVAPELVSALRQHFSDAAIVELAMMVAVENQRSRFNGGLGLVSQGFCATARP